MEPPPPKTLRKHRRPSRAGLPRYSPAPWWHRVATKTMLVLRTRMKLARSDMDWRSLALLLLTALMLLNVLLDLWAH